MRVHEKNCILLKYKFEHYNSFLGRRRRPSGQRRSARLKRVGPTKAAQGADACISLKASFNLLCLLRFVAGSEGVADHRNRHSDSRRQFWKSWADSQWWTFRLHDIGLSSYKCVD